ncbi:MAG: hypothetical protein IJG18_10985 [Kiritimatiellae bacterium]|nr:hypothetical protein [Kiritimatiellia bacterium]
MKSANNVIPPFRRAAEMRRGAALMEYIIAAVLIAVACLIAVIVFGRGIVRNTDIMNKATVGRGQRAGEAAEIYRADTEADVKEAEKFPAEFSDAGN